MNKKTYITIGVVGLAILVAGIYVGATNSTALHFFNRNATSSSAYIDVTPPLGEARPASEMANEVPPTNPNGEPQNTGQQTDWQVYENTKYGYRISYPSGISVVKGDKEYRAQTSESQYIDLFQPGGKTGIGISVLPLDKGGSARQVAEQYRTTEVADKNANFPNKRVSEVEEITFAGEQAYTYTVVASCCRWGEGSIENVFFDRVISGQSFTYFIEYSLNDTLSEQIADTLTLY